MIPTLRARAPQGERERSIPAETIAEMQAAGLFKVLQPKRWGGYEMDIGTYFEVQMALGEGDMSVAWVYGVVGVHPWFVALLDERAEQDIWGQRQHHADLLLADAGRHRQAGRRRLSPQRHLEIRLRLRALRMGVPRRHRGRQPGRPARVRRPAQGLRHRRHLARAGPEGDRQQRHHH